MRGETPSQDTLVDAIIGPRRTSDRQGAVKRSVAQPMLPNNSHCGRCGRPGFLQCPARAVVCHNCGKTGHYKLMCRRRTTGLNFVESGRKLPTAEDSDDNDDYLGVIYASGDVSAVDSPDPKCHKTLTMNERDLTFKVDTGADVTVIPSTSYSAQ